ncbi:SAM-dependent methyltransferase [Altericista sp. CCNU0014]|uniref:SAM-dependent methyltransferase n=1 Tax=Altericista sp. CCNU0014 TaxID=3082949 RepID=UPI00384FF27C
MKEALLPKPLLTIDARNEVFICQEESQFYAQCLESMVFKYCDATDTVVEFGAGDGGPVISALLKNDFNGIIHGFELNYPSYELARSNIKKYHLEDRYVVHNRCFFNDLRLEANYLIANPPYLPAPDNNLYIPSLHGGTDGADITKRLLSLGYQNVMLMISAYSNPIEVVNYAADRGYKLVDFMLSPLRFGYYSCEPKVRAAIAELRRRNQAFYSENIYFLSGVLFRKDSESDLDLSEEFIKVMTIL